MAHAVDPSGSQDDAWAQDIDYGSDDDDDDDGDMDKGALFAKFDDDDGSNSLPGPGEANGDDSGSGGGIPWKRPNNGDDDDGNGDDDGIGNLSLSGSSFSESNEGPGAAAGGGGGIGRIGGATEITFDLPNPYDIEISHELKIDKTETDGNISDDDFVAGLKYNQFKLAGKEIKNVNNNENDESKGKGKDESKNPADDTDDTSDPFLGEGAFAKVLRARDMNNGGKYVALKSMIKRDLGKKFVMKSKYDTKNQIPIMDRATVLDLVKNEIKIMLHLKHGNVIQLLGVIDDPRKDELFIVIEYAPFGQVMDWHAKHHRYVPNKIFHAQKNNNNNNNKNNNKNSKNNEAKENVDATTKGKEKGKGKGKAKTKGKKSTNDNSKKKNAKDSKSKKNDSKKTTAKKNNSTSKKGSKTKKTDSKQTKSSKEKKTNSKSKKTETKKKSNEKNSTDRSSKKSTNTGKSVEPVVQQRPRKASYTKECAWRGQNEIGSKSTTTSPKAKPKQQEEENKDDAVPEKLLRFRENTAKILFAQCVEALLYRMWQQLLLYLLCLTINIAHDRFVFLFFSFGLIVISSQESYYSSRFKTRKYVIICQ